MAILRGAFGRGCGFGLLAHEHLLGGGDFGFERAHLVDGGLELDAREDAGDFADFLAGLQSAPRERREAHGFDRLRHAELRPDLARAFGQHGIKQRGDDAQRFGGGV